MNSDWADQETWRAVVWDRRCLGTLALCCRRLALGQQVSFSRALGSARKSMSRILHHPSITPEDLLVSHIEATCDRARGHDRILVSCDTTSFDFTSHSALEGLGPIGTRVQGRGILAHSCLALTSEGTPLGLLGQRSWVRDPQAVGSARDRRLREARDKESFRWVEEMAKAQATLPSFVGATFLMDREADIFEVLCAPRRAGVDYIVRAAQPRRVSISGEGPSGTLFEQIMGAPLLGTRTVSVHPRPDRSGREALLSLRLLRLQVLPPRQGACNVREGVWVWVVAAREESPPSGLSAVEWVLLTSLPTASAEEAWQRVDTYAKRWQVERFHYVLKSGCRFERLQVDTVPALCNALSLLSIVAWRLLYILHQAREQPEAPASEVLSHTERDVLEAATGQPVESVEQAVMAIARIGGFRPCPSAPRPGVMSLWIGLRTLEAMIRGYQLGRQIPENGPP